MSINQKHFLPFQLFEYDHQPGEYCLQLSDTHMLEKEELFSDNGRYGNGYGWSDVAVYAMRSQDPSLESKINLNPEAGTFVAFGKNLSALQKLAQLLFEAYNNPQTLAEWVSKAPYEWD